MNILFDENIPCGREAFSRLGTVRSCAGREITAETLKECELLFVRSVTRVNSELLEGTAVRFVATATSGSDHIDKEYLAGAGIGFSDAIGCNANSVAEYVVSALMMLSRRDGFELAGKTIGVIGVGHVGKLVVQKARILGMQVLQNDPPRQRAEPDFNGVSLEEALQADIISVHVPLTKDGEDPTWHLLNKDRLASLRSETILLQPSRGAVVDTKGLKELLQAGTKLTTVLDVWEGEPNIDRELLSLVDVGTPHIAGYSWISKIRGTWIVYEAACRFFGVEADWQPPIMPEGVHTPERDLSGSGDQVYDAVTGIYTILEDDARLRAFSGQDGKTMGQYFDTLRKTYPVRLEFDQAKADHASGEALDTIQKLGFQSV